MGRNLGARPIVLVVFFLALACNAKSPVLPNSTAPTPVPVPTPRPDQLVFEWEEQIEPYEGLGHGFRAPLTGTYLIELTYTPGPPQGRADLWVSAEGFPIQYLAKVEGEEHPKRVELRYQAGERITASAHCRRPPSVVAHMKYTLRGE